MKKTKNVIIFLILLIASLNVMNAQDYYWSNNKKIFLVKDEGKFLVRASEKSNTESRLTKESSIESLDRINSYSILVKLKSTEKSILDNLSLLTNNRIVSFKTASGHKAIPTGEILFMPKKGVSFDRVNKLSGNQLSIVKEKYGTFRVFIENYNELLNISNKIYESGLVEYCHPNFIMDITKFQNDPLYPDQYYLNNTGQLGGTWGIDINAPQAWNINEGIHGVRVAVLDDGVENHIDMNGRVVQGFTPVNPNGFGAPIIQSNHGQACAGIIAATRDNNEGIAGIAPNFTEIVPINIFAGNESTADLAAAIDWAWDEGEADVLSNSWGFTQQGTYHDNIAQAIGRARTQGRNGNGAIVVFASGNSNQVFNGVTFPANVSGVITVGAVDNNGNIWNYSSRGSEMDLVAPSGNTNNNGNVRTTDRPGNPGYTNNNYVNTFGGTSAACPQVAGVAALMLSVRPNLTESNIVNILRNTATNMGPSGFDNTFGYGRLNAQKALESAIIGNITINGPSIVCASNEVFTLVNGNPSPVLWTVSPNLERVSYTNSSVTVKWLSAPGPATIEAHFDGVTVTKNVTAGPAPLGLEIYPAGVGYLNVVVHGGSPPFKFYKNGTLIHTNNYGNPSIINFGCQGALLYVTASHQCGTSEGYEYIYTGCSSFFSVSPNPSDSEISITQNTVQDSPEAMAIRPDPIGNILAEIYDFYGNRVKQVNFSSNLSIRKINVSDLRQGVYILKINHEKGTETHQLILK